MATANGLAAVRSGEDVGNAQIAPDFSAQFKTLKTSFGKRSTQSYAWRLQQLKQLEKLLVEKCDEIIQSVKDDLARPTNQALMGDVSYVLKPLI